MASLDREDDPRKEQWIWVCPTCNEEYGTTIRLGQQCTSCRKTLISVNKVPKVKNLTMYYKEHGPFRSKPALHDGFYNIIVILPNKIEVLVRKEQYLKQGQFAEFNDDNTILEMLSKT